MSKLHPRSRWKFPNARYNEKVYDLLRFLFAEPHGFHQGARLLGAHDANAIRRQFIIKARHEALDKLYALQGTK